MVYFDVIANFNLHRTGKYHPHIREKQFPDTAFGIASTAWRCPRPSALKQLQSQTDSHAPNLLSRYGLFGLFKSEFRLNTNLSIGPDFVGSINIFTRDAKWAHHCGGALATEHTSDEGVDVSAFATQSIAFSTARSVAVDRSPCATEEIQASWLAVNFQLSGAGFGLLLSSGCCGIANTT